MMVLVAPDAVPRITTLVGFRVPGILSIALQAHVVPPAPAFRVVLAPFGLDLQMSQYFEIVVIFPSRQASSRQSVNGFTWTAGVDDFQIARSNGLLIDGSQQR